MGQTCGTLTDSRGRDYAGWGGGGAVMGVAITQPPEAILSFPVGARAHSARPQNGEPGYGLEALEGSRRGRNFQGPRAPGASRLPGTAPLCAGTRTCLPPRDGARCGDFIAEPRKRELASREARAGWR